MSRTSDRMVLGTRYAVLSTSDGRTGTFTLTGDLNPSGFLALTDSCRAPDNAIWAWVVQTRSLTDASGIPTRSRPRPAHSPRPTQSPLLLPH